MKCAFPVKPTRPTTVFYCEKSIVYLALIVYPRCVKIIILFRVTTFKSSIFSVHKSYETIARGGSALDWGVQCRGPHTRVVPIFLRVDCASLAFKMKNLEYSRVKRGYEPLEHRTSLLDTREI